MATYSLTGADNFIIAGVPVYDFADGDNLSVTFPNDMVAAKRGKNGNSIFADNAMGGLAEVVARVIRGSRTDKFWNSLQAAQKFDLSSFVLLGGIFQKRAGNGLGFITNDSYLFNAGVFKKQVEAQSNVEGNTDQAISIYNFIFADTVRGLL